MGFKIYGHACSRKLLMNDSGKYRELTMPGGSQLLARLLGVENGDAEAAATEYIQLIKDGSSCSFGASLGLTGEISETVTGDGENIIVFDEGYGIAEIANDIQADKKILWASEKRLPSEGVWENIKGNAFLVLDADVLRSNGALISKQVSWERTATDLLWQLKNNSKFAGLFGAKYIFIVFAEEAGVLLRGDRSEFSARLWLRDGRPEGTLKAEHPGNIPDVWTVKAAHAAGEWFLAGRDEDKFFDDFDAIGALDPAARLQETGYGICDIESGDFSGWLAHEPRSSLAVFDIPEPVDKQAADPGYWCIGQSFQNLKLYDLAMNYVKYGRKVIDGIPKFQSGGLITVDRREIEAFQNIKNLIAEYVSRKNPRNPLSIAVFGAPGSGKSFGVKQIAKALGRDLIEPVEINVSQLTGAGDLSAAFHQVRDIVLKGKLPLVFFDEFDSDGLQWLKSFLAPMQDGEFRDENGVHPIGKCIFVFAGGTAVSFDDFVSPITMKRSDGIPESEAEESEPHAKTTEEKTGYAEFKSVKAPDFVSRLRGTIDILGPNQAQGGNEQGFILRRALLLRSFLEDKKRKLTDGEGVALVSDDILRAMLLIEKYEHGARSMEAILDMSRMEGASFEPVSLPFYTQMKIHVDADAFIRLVLKDVILNGYLEELAETIHEDFRANQKKRGLSINKNVDLPWAELSEQYKNDNRWQAEDIPGKLALIDCAFDLGDAPYPTVYDFTEDEATLLAEREHARWMKGKEAAGWKPGPVRDDEKKIHNLLVPFEKLPPDEKQKDIDVAKNIFALLKKAGLRVYRVV
ncbi:MAG: AAA family ATPase [Clostridiales Family XIII bacterium]|jgi:hypothetical protein|nr:AAA family ATPase [Clostridiales Family XIII bacterium]